MAKDNLPYHIAVNMAKEKPINTNRYTNLSIHKQFNKLYLHKIQKNVNNDTAKPNQDTSITPPSPKPNDQKLVDMNKCVKKKTQLNSTNNKSYQDRLVEYSNLKKMSKILQTNQCIQCRIMKKTSTFSQSYNSMPPLMHNIPKSIQQHQMLFHDTISEMTTLLSETLDTFLSDINNPNSKCMAHKCQRIAANLNILLKPLQHVPQYFR